MSKRLDLIKPLWDSIKSSSEKKPCLLCTDLAYMSMDLSALRFLRGNCQGIEEAMKEARNYLPINHDFNFEQRETWQRGINDYNRLSRFYRNQGLDIESIEIVCDIPYQTPEILQSRILIKRTFREIEKVEGKRRGLSDKEIRRKIMDKGLGV